MSHMRLDKAWGEPSIPTVTDGWAYFAICFCGLVSNFSIQDNTATLRVLDMDCSIEQLMMLRVKLSVHQGFDMYSLLMIDIFLWFQCVQRTFQYVPFEGG